MTRWLIFALALVGITVDELTREEAASLILDRNVKVSRR